MGDRLNRYGETIQRSGENISYGMPTPMEVVIQLIVDDGVPSRGHRTNIFQAAFKEFGCATGPHKRYSTMSSMNYAGGFTKHGAVHPMKQAQEDFMKEPVDFGNEMPSDARGWGDSMSISYNGDVIIKHVTRTVTCSGGRKVTLKKVVQRDLGQKGELPKVEVIVPTNDGVAPEKAKEPMLPK